MYPNKTKLIMRDRGYEYCGDDRGCLYNIINDSGDHINLALKIPDKLNEMRDRLIEYQETH